MRTAEGRRHRWKREGRAGGRPRSARARARGACGRRRRSGRITCGVSARRPDRAVARPSSVSPGRARSSTSSRYLRERHHDRGRRRSGRTCSARTTCSRRRCCSSWTASCGLRARRSSGCRSSGSSLHMRRSTSATGLSGVQLRRRCEAAQRGARPAAQSLDGNPLRRASLLEHHGAGGLRTVPLVLGRRPSTPVEPLGLRRRARRRARARSRSSVTWTAQSTSSSPLRTPS